MVDSCEAGKTSHGCQINKQSHWLKPLAPAINGLQDKAELPQAQSLTSSSAWLLGSLACSASGY